MFFVLYAKYLKLFTSGLNKNFYRNDRQPLVNRLSVGERRIFIAGRWEEGKWGNGRGHPFPFSPYYLTIAFLPFPQLRSLVPG